MQPLPDKEFIERQSKLIALSYEQQLGRPLAEKKEGESWAEVLFYAPYVICSATCDEDPILNYGNDTALRLWEMDWETFTKTPGRHTAEPMEREQREKFLKQVKENGFIENYSGIRISSTGKRFEIKQATVWNLVDEVGQYQGQAATFKEWRFLKV